MTASRTLACAAAAALALLSAGPAAGLEPDIVRLAISNRLPTAADPVLLTVSGFSTGCPVHFADPVLQGNTIRLDGQPIVTVLPCPPGEWSETFRLPALVVGGYTVDVRVSGTLRVRDSLAVQAAAPGLTFHDGAFGAGVTWKNPYGPGEGVGHPIQLGDDSGAFWFFGPGNVEVTLKILDGRPVNGHFWVFLAGMSTVEYTVTITRCPTNPMIGAPCVEKSYHNPPFTSRNVVDVEAF